MLVSHGFFPWDIFAIFRKFALLRLQVRSDGFLTAEFKSLKTNRMKCHAYLFSYDNNNTHGRKDTLATNTIFYCFMS